MPPPLHLEVKMRTGRGTGLATESNGLPALDEVAFFYGNPREMRVYGANVTAMAQHDDHPISTHLTSEFHGAAFHGQNGRAQGSSEVDTFVQVRK